MSGLTGGIDNATRRNQTWLRHRFGVPVAPIKSEDPVNRSNGGTIGVKEHRFQVSALETNREKFIAICGSGGNSGCHVCCGFINVLDSGKGRGK
jgi:hypothetical protein